MTVKLKTSEGYEVEKLAGAAVSIEVDGHVLCLVVDCNGMYSLHQGVGDWGMWQGSVLIEGNVNAQ